MDRLDLIKHVEESNTRHQPQVLYVHHAGFLNVHHCRLHEAVVTASRPMPGQLVRLLLSFQISSSTEWQQPVSVPAFQSNWFVDITAQLPSMRDELSAFAIEIHPWSHARLLEELDHLTRWVGAQVAVEASESLCILRQLV